MAEGRVGTPQTYQLHILLHQDISLQIGKLGEFFFPAGLYIYTGSARRGMTQRLERHSIKGKKCRWHIDYLLTHPQTEIIRVTKHVDAECTVNAATPGTIIVPGFGASDCRSGCKSHLKYPTPTTHARR
ncbi:GIY-YIG nuclease family protein [candidate division KSB1 bacterium]|nr:GIY-YIG nuclease family protein [candidate division KSB1 bacterium]RQW02885.1 MAG: GIY-YIG nuclease family protein [candidate division KSB1 bacterium]